MAKALDPKDPPASVVLVPVRANTWADAPCADRLLSTLQSSDELFSLTAADAPADIFKRVADAIVNVTARTGCDNEQDKSSQCAFGKWAYGPAIIHSELMRASADAEQWWRKVGAFSRSCAVMSMLGYVIGLGDRHLDNILIDLRSGGPIQMITCRVQAAQPAPCTMVTPRCAQASCCTSTTRSVSSGASGSKCQSTCRSA